MNKLEKTSKNNGFILPIVLFLVFILIWLFSMILSTYKSEVSNYKSIKNSNEKYWVMENLSTIGEYEVFKGEKAIKKGEYKDIIEYFEDKNLIWIDSDVISKSGYKREEIKHNEILTNNKIELVPFIENTLEIKLLKDIYIENQSIEIKVILFYKYLRGEVNLFNSYQREIRGVEVRLKNENY